jgi:hypothetical protein
MSLLVGSNPEPALLLENGVIGNYDRSDPKLPEITDSTIRVRQTE